MNVTVQTRDGSGRLLQEAHAKNAIVFGGRAAICQLLGYGGTAPNYIAMGTGSTAVKDADVALENEIFRNAITRTVLDASKVTYQLHVLATQGNTYTINEVGLFIGPVVGYTTAVAGLSAVTGAMFARAIITPTTKDSSVTLTITWEIPIQSSED